jgi:glycosyltransferase involved in cell wall biosynthesis
LATGNVYVQASHQEGLPNAVLEAMASALPAVVTRVSGHEDVIVDGDNGLLVPPNDPQALAEALGKLAFDPPARERMGAAARRFVERHFSTSRVLESLLAIYSKT